MDTPTPNIYAETGGKGEASFHLSIESPTVTLSCPHCSCQYPVMMLRQHAKECSSKSGPDSPTVSRQPESPTVSPPPPEIESLQQKCNETEMSRSAIAYAERDLASRCGLQNAALQETAPVTSAQLREFLFKAQSDLWNRLPSSDTALADTGGTLSDADFFAQMAPVSSGLSGPVSRMGSGAHLPTEVSAPKVVAQDTFVSVRPLESTPWDLSSQDHSLAAVKPRHPPEHYEGPRPSRNPPAAWPRSGISAVPSYATPPRVRIRRLPPTPSPMAAPNSQSSTEELLAMLNRGVPAERPTRTRALVPQQEPAVGRMSAKPALLAGAPAFSGHSGSAIPSFLSPPRPKRASPPVTDVSESAGAPLPYSERQPVPDRPAVQEVPRTPPQAHLRPQGTAVAPRSAPPVPGAVGVMHTPQVPLSPAWGDSVRPRRRLAWGDSQLDAEERERDVLVPHPQRNDIVVRVESSTEQDVALEFKVHSQDNSDITHGSQPSGNLAPVRDPSELPKLKTVQRPIMAEIHPSTDPRTTLRHPAGRGQNGRPVAQASAPSPAVNRQAFSEKGSAQTNEKESSRARASVRAQQMRLEAEREALRRKAEEQAREKEREGRRQRARQRELQRQQARQQHKLQQQMKDREALRQRQLMLEKEALRQELLQGQQQGHGEGSYVDDLDDDVPVAARAPLSPVPVTSVSARPATASDNDNGLVDEAYSELLARTKLNVVACPHCTRRFTPNRLDKHVRACIAGREHPQVPAPISSPLSVSMPQAVNANTRDPTTPLLPATSTWSKIPSSAGIERGPAPAIDGSKSARKLHRDNDVVAVLGSPLGQEQLIPESRIPRPKTAPPAPRNIESSPCQQRGRPDILSLDRHEETQENLPPLSASLRRTLNAGGREFFGVLSPNAPEPESSEVQPRDQTAQSVSVGHGDGMDDRHPESPQSEDYFSQNAYEKEDGSEEAAVEELPHTRTESVSEVLEDDGVTTPVPQNDAAEEQPPDPVGTPPQKRREMASFYFDPPLGLASYDNSPKPDKRSRVRSAQDEIMGAVFQAPLSPLQHERDQGHGSTGTPGAELVRDAQRDGRRLNVSDLRAAQERNLTHARSQHSNAASVTDAAPKSPSAGARVSVSEEGREESLRHRSYGLRVLGLDSRT